MMSGEQQEEVQGQFGIRHRGGGQYTPGSCPTGSACCRIVRPCDSSPRWSKSSPEYGPSVVVRRRPTTGSSTAIFPASRSCRPSCWSSCWRRPAAWRSAAARAAGEPLALRVAALGGFKFPGAATAGDVLEATARVAGRMGGLYKIEGEVTAGGRVVGTGAITLAEARR